MPLPDASLLIALACFIEGGFVLGAAGTWLAGRRLDQASLRARWMKLAVYFVIVHGCLAVPLLGSVPLAVFFGLLALLGAMELIRLKPGAGFQVLALVLWAGAGASGVLLSFTKSPGWFLWVYAQVAVLDAYSQIFGQLVGRHRLAPSISPAKTWEGAAGGFLSSLLAGTLLRGLSGLDWLPALLIAAAIAVTAIVSDLAAAKYKRLSGVKDYGRLIPGHGGVVDRFNSLFGVVLAAGLASLI